MCVCARLLMFVCARLLLLAALPALAGLQGAVGEVVAVTEGAGPSFVPHQRLAQYAVLGDAVDLSCLVQRLGDKSVSWVRSRDLYILSHADVVFAADARVSAEARGSRHLLRIQRLRASDAGRYECQVNTEPKMSLFFNLTVLESPLPAPSITVTSEREVRAAAGAAASAACEARYERHANAPPDALPDLDILWQKDGRNISLDGARVGGVSLETRRWARRAESRLTLAALRPEDAGQYSCLIASWRPLVADTVTLYVHDTGGEMEAMQRDQSAARVSAASPPLDYAALILLLAAISLILYCR